MHYWFPNVEISFFPLEFYFSIFQCLSFLIQKEMVFLSHCILKDFKMKIWLFCFFKSQSHVSYREEYIFILLLSKKTGSRVDVVECGLSIKFTPLILLSPCCFFFWAFLELPWARFGTCCHKGFRGPENQPTTFNPLKSHKPTGYHLLSVNSESSQMYAI